MQHAKAQKQAATFFQPFRKLGRQKLAASRQFILTQQENNLAQGAPLAPSPRINLNHSQRETDQVNREVSEQTQQNSQHQRQRARALDGLAGSVLSGINEGADTREEVSSDSDLTGPGTFHVPPLCDQIFSTDSSYSLSGQRDVGFTCDTWTSSSGTSGTPSGYRQAHRQRQIDQAEVLLQRMNAMYDEHTNEVSQQEQDTNTSYPKTIISSNASSLTDPGPFHIPPLRDQSSSTDSSYSWGGDANEPRRQGNRLAVSSSSDTISNETRRSDAGSRNLGTSTQGSSSFEQLLRFPISRIAEANDVRPQTVTQRLSAEVKDDSIGTESTMGGLLHWTNLPVGGKPFPPTRIYIEEVTPEVGAETPLDILRHEQYYIPLAQGTPGSEVDTVVEESVDTLTDFREWIAGLRGFTPPSTASEATSSSSSDCSSTTTSSTIPILDILPTPEPSTSSTSNNRDKLEGYIYRSLTLQPPSEEQQAEDNLEASMPSLVAGNGDDGTLSDGTSIEELLLEGATIRSSPFAEKARMLEGRESDDGQMVVVEGAEDGLPQWIYGMAQGMTMSPAEYVLMDAHFTELNAAVRAYYERGDPQYLAQSEGEFYDREYAYDQSTLGEVQAELTGESVPSSPADSIASSTDSYIAGYEYYTQDPLGSYYGEANEGNIILAANDRRTSISLEGDTVASTASYMSEVEVTRMGQRAPQVDGYLVEIPVRELDDPPDGSDDEAASL